MRKALATQAIIPGSDTLVLLPLHVTLKLIKNLICTVWIDFMSDEGRRYNMTNLTKLPHYQNILQWTGLHLA